MASDLSVRRSAFLRQTQTLSEISQNTGIPVSTLSYVSRGERNLPSKYVGTLRNYYQRSVYRTMRDGGISVNQAHRFSWYNPERINQVLVQFETKIKFLTEGYVANYKRYIGDIADDNERFDVWYDGEAAIRDGINNSEKTFEEWMDYGKSEPEGLN